MSTTRAEEDVIRSLKGWMRAHDEDTYAVPQPCEEAWILEGTDLTNCRALVTRHDTFGMQWRAAWWREVGSFVVHCKWAQTKDEAMDLVEQAQRSGRHLRNSKPAPAF